MSEAKCTCQFCNGHIAFPAEMAGQMSACPHCGLETKLFIPNVTKALANSPPKNVSVEIKRGANPLGIASLVLGISACVFCWIPFLGLLAIPLAGVGLLLAIIGITAASVGKKSNLSFPVGGTVVCTAAILIALFVTGGKWSKSLLVQQGDLQIQVEPNSGAIYPNSPGRIATPNDGIFTIKLSNLSKTRKADFTIWGKETFSGAALPTLTDDNGNSYKINSDLTGSPDGDVRGKVPIYPNSYYEERLTFETPVSNRKWLHLELPAANFGGSGMIRFEIPNPDILAKKEDITPKSFNQGDVDVIINDVVHGFQTGESPTERGLIVKTSNFLLVTIDLNNSSSDKICDYTTFRRSAVLTDNKGNNYNKLERFAGRNLNTRNEEYGRVTDGWVSPNYTLFADVKFYADSSRIQPKTGREDMLGFEIPNSPGDVLYLELPAANFGGTGKIKFEIPVNRIKNW